MLIRLDFRHNQIRVPPSCLLLVPKLNKVALNGNPIKAEATKKLTKELEARSGAQKCLVIG